jgi:hypothetical protein
MSILRRLLKALFWGRRAILTVPLFLALGFVGFIWARYQIFYRNFSDGTRTGIVRKLSTKRSSKGLPLCRYTAVEMVMQGTQPGINGDLWVFSVDDDRPDSPVIDRLSKAEKSGERVTVHYRQDLHRFWSCSESEYFVTGVE